MKKLLLLLSSLLLIWACSTKDDENITNPENTSTQKESSVTIDSNLDILDTSFIELLSVDSCIGHMDYKNPNLGIDTFYAKKYNENAYSIRVLTNQMCPPAEPPDYVEYSYKEDTLVVLAKKKNPSFDVACTCMFWIDLLVKGEINFNYIEANALVYIVKKESDEEEN